ncbi:carboxypeptidase-like regulatory domain-containing protein, partial [Flavobacterium sp. FlaQc-48]
SIDPVSGRGYFSSNKDGGQGSDDIYKFLETRKLKCVQELEGIITDVQTNAILPETKVTLYENQIIKNTTVSDASGVYHFAVECGKTYAVRAEKQDYATKEMSVTIGKVTGKTSLPIGLDKSICKVT